MSTGKTNVKSVCTADSSSNANIEASGAHPISSQTTIPKSSVQEPTTQAGSRLPYRIDHIATIGMDVTSLSTSNPLLYVDSGISALATQYHNCSLAISTLDNLSRRGSESSSSVNIGPSAAFTPSSSHDWPAGSSGPVGHVASAQHSLTGSHTINTVVEAGSSQGLQSHPSMNIHVRHPCPHSLLLLEPRDPGITSHIVPPRNPLSNSPDLSFVGDLTSPEAPRS
ncbi:hypothetical protein JAAARDRAFT_189014 [Jaapia argillacea MUCL 33604]|uniref:Uncharacterized protein n=1 Tax=Jaapia argillacea MUCL 33604 TaxID=933084 RepID=A0A067QIX6_9AGAM|nr:hypothetical protein JAAARDRAFT_189014 [Jaapia argillacea MUCL 33604]